MGVAVTRAKLLIFGEHVAVYGQPAVGLTLPWTLRVSHHPGTTWELPGLGPYQESVLELVRRVEGLGIEAGLPAPEPGILELATNIPVSSGFGSSGALCGALVSVFWPDLSVEQREVLAWKAEGLFHGTSSGIDTALSLREGWWALDTTNHPVGARPLPDPELTLIVGAVVRSDDTKTWVRRLAERRAEQDPIVLDAFSQLGQASRLAIQRLEDREVKPLSPLLHQARQSLRALGLETVELTRALDCAESSKGCLGAKLSGAGGGGAFFAAFDNPDDAERALAPLSEILPETAWTFHPTVIAPLRPFEN